MYSTVKPWGCVCVLATAAPDDIRQESLRQLEEQHGKDGLCEALCSTPGYDRLLVELACTASTASARTEAAAVRNSD